MGRTRRISALGRPSPPLPTATCLSVHGVAQRCMCQVPWPYPLSWYKHNDCHGPALLRDRTTDQWMYGPELLLDKALQGEPGYVPLLSHMSFLSGRCGSTTHKHRMEQMAKVALADPCTSRAERKIVAHFWNIDDEITFPAWPLLNNATYISGPQHVGCRPQDMGAAFVCTFKPTVRAGWQPPQTSHAATAPPARMSVRMRRVIEVPYVENSHCYDHALRLHVGSERTTAVYFRGGINVFGAQGKRVRRGMHALRLRASWAKIVCTVHTNMKAGEPGCRTEETSKELMAKEMLQSRFCLVPRGDMPDSGRLYDSMACGCIPVIISDRFRGAFADVVNYERFSLRISEQAFLADPVNSVGNLTRLLTRERERKMRHLLDVEGAAVLWHHERSAITSLIRDAIGASQARAMSLTMLSSWQ